ncbi:hypothetical protein, conserved [Eimeria brunetti]|uniref:3-oxo-5-alpha-steroid 4-dehydrogenase C-terminal domain-containing protein n=1 Tax=Eimeria brunetti TaxID=51314 RepID=U6LT67_9EIME|nr:hypothetical protein, conserved [Eimeria brunetti]
MVTVDVAISEGPVQWLLCLYFLAAAAAAAAAARWPLCASFAAHGKMRRQRQQQKQQEEEREQPQQQLLQQQSRLLLLLRWVESKDCSKRRFIDFYITGVFVTCCCLLLLQQQQQQQQQQEQQQQQSNLQLLPLTLLLLHLLRRLGEQALLVASEEASRMHIFAYALGLTFYIATPLAFLCASRRRQGPLLLQAVAAVGLWAVSTLLQFAVHVSLASLRRQGAPKGDPADCGGPSEAARGAADKHLVAKKRRSSNSNSSRSSRSTEAGSSSDSSRSSSGSSQAQKQRGPYRVPRGPLFAYVSCPHYLSEALIYLSLFISAPDVPT